MRRLPFTEKKHYIIQTMYYHFKTIAAGRPQMKTIVLGDRMFCGRRIGCSDFPGIWMVSGTLDLNLDDTFEMTDKEVNIYEYGERVRRMKDYSLAVTGKECDMGAYVYEDNELRSGAGIGGLRPAPLCAKCKGSGRLEYEITNHGERNERVWDKCNGCGGTGRLGKAELVKGYSAR